MVEKLTSFKERLVGEVAVAYDTRGREFGANRFSSWRRKLTQFLDEALPGESSRFNTAISSYMFVGRYGETDLDSFFRQYGEKSISYIDSLIIDVENEEYEYNSVELATPEDVTPSVGPKSKVFIVHGHDGEVKERTARFIEKLGFEPIILHEKSNQGMTIIEKINKYADEVDFGIVLYTPDDLGNVKSEAEQGQLKGRARQNVVFEHGLLIGKLGRNNVTPLVLDNVEIPNDLSGIVYINDSDWQIDIAKEMKSAGYEIDFNKLL